ncbi:MAG: 2-C-methyl-D-erythritol 4-phosphate cytidylyltransferase [Oscillospiraceae bacterium]|nr:2-C-methyl-D-erythritol 4-phosphate cytidylyltransferase [Oscillospiraceae bacterium]
MIYAAVLAGGAGIRMRRDDLPKQFLPLGGKSILAHSALRFLNNTNIDKVLIAVPDDWLAYTEHLFSSDKDAGVHSAKIVLVQGGADRNSSLMAVVDKIVTLYGVADDDIIVSHDAVRPFFTQRIIDENIEACKICGAAATIYPFTDTPVLSTDGETISNIPVRNGFYVAQTPQTFNIKLLMEVYTSLSDDDKSILTDASKMFVLKNKTVRIVQGESYNLKITTPFDYILAQALINENNIE